jgi:hypothetical protein
MDAAFEHLTHLKSDSQTGDERARQRDAIIEYSNGSSSIALYVGLGSPCQAVFDDSLIPSSMTHANQCSSFGGDNPQPLV